MKYTIFFSWQSDLDKETTTKVIRTSITKASADIMEKMDVIIASDEATKETTGSPHISRKIFEKIDYSDIFICDITTIIKNDTKSFPNPNVLIELGYAIATLGWDRIILLFNKKYCDFKDLPFDIEKHRATPFSVTEKNDKQGKEKLIDVLKFAISAIIEKKPEKPPEKKSMSLGEIKRSSDVKNVKWAMSSIHFATFDRFVEMLPSYMPNEILFFEEGFRSKIDSSYFHLYDENLVKYFSNLKKNWYKAVSFGEHFISIEHGYKFNHNPYIIEESDKAYKNLSRLPKKLNNDFKSLLNYIRINYLEINLDELSVKAMEEYNSYIK